MRKKKVKEMNDLERFAEDVTNKIKSYIRGLEDDAYTFQLLLLSK